MESLFQSTRPVRGATDRSPYTQEGRCISIHAPRAGRDVLYPESAPADWRISIHAPRAGRDGADTLRDHADKISIHAPRAGRDNGFSGSDCRPNHISIHAPRAGRDMLHGGFSTQCSYISIHAPRAGRDTAVYPRPCYRLDFNPRAPCGARPSQNSDFANVGEISIHAPRAGRDEFVGRVLTLYVNFNPRAPCGARPLIIFPGVRGKLFQSTRPVRGATWHEPATR